MGLVLLAAPIGNTGDASNRLREVLSTADVVAAEDTRRLARLAREIGVSVTGRVVSYFDGNERARTAELVESAHAGTVALITDAGMPTVSDPGYRLVRAAIDAGVTVTAVPGPSAVTTALALSGLPCDRFCFEGFPSRRRGERRAAFATLATQPRTMVFFEAPHRIDDTVADLATALGGDRQAALCRELTKVYEEVRRGTLAELAAGIEADPPRGEITLVVAGAPATPAVRPAPGALAAEVGEREREGTPRKAAIAEVAARYGMPKREVYDAVVRAAG